MKPVIEVRVVNFTWTEESEGAPYPLVRHEWRFEYKRENDDNWYRIPVLELSGKPDIGTLEERR
jgi:hypothetical protein